DQGHPARQSLAPCGSGGAPDACGRPLAAALAPRQHCPITSPRAQSAGTTRAAFCCAPTPSAEPEPEPIVRRVSNSGPRCNSGRRAMAFLRPFRAQLLSLLRIMTGLLILQHGSGKYLNFPAGPMNNASPLTPGGAAGLIELVGGVLVTIGLFT